MIFRSTRRDPGAMNGFGVVQIALHARFRGKQARNLTWWALICGCNFRLLTTPKRVECTSSPYRLARVPRTNFVYQCDLCVGQEVTQVLLASGHFEAMTPRMDEDEHSIEMHLPFIKKVTKWGGRYMRRTTNPLSPVCSRRQICSPASLHRVTVGAMMYVNFAHSV